MKVKELIEELQKCQQNYDVFGYDCLGSVVAIGGRFAEIEVYPNEQEVWI